MLSIHQSQIVRDAIEHLKREQRVLISGSAGTGKTFILKHLVSQFLQDNDIIDSISDGKIIFSAPTNKAVQVLRERISSSFISGYPIPFSTVHSLLNMRNIVNEETGTIEFRPMFVSNRKENPLFGVILLVIDEVSMLNEEIFNLLKQELIGKGIYTVFIGDSNQLPPIGEKISPVFKDNIPCCELKEIIRQKKDNPIISLSQNLHLLRSLSPLENSHGGYQIINQEDKIIELLSDFSEMKDIKYIAYTNREVNRINNLVRHRIFNGKARKIEKGETIIMDSPFENYYTNQELYVRKSTEKILHFKYPNLEKLPSKKGKTPKMISLPLRCYEVCSENHKEPLIILHEQSEADFFRLSKDLRMKAIEGKIRWSVYYNWLDNFATIKYNHALTIHKSQGSTYRCVIINLKDIDKNSDEEEKMKMLYTAITRASERIIFCWL